jgi:hypothetical protein
VTFCCTNRVCRQADLDANVESVRSGIAFAVFGSSFRSHVAHIRTSPSHLIAGSLREISAYALLACVSTANSRTYCAVEVFETVADLFNARSVVAADLLSSLMARSLGDACQAYLNSMRRVKSSSAVDIMNACKRLVEYLHSHSADPDNCLQGQFAAPGVSLLVLCHLTTVHSLALGCTRERMQVTVSPEAFDAMARAREAEQLLCAPTLHKELAAWRHVRVLFVHRMRALSTRFLCSSTMSVCWSAHARWRVTSLTAGRCVCGAIGVCTS